MTTVFRKRAASSKNEQLTVGHIKAFHPCTSNLDPYLRKCIRELVIAEHGNDRADVDEEREATSTFTQLEKHHLASAQFLFDDLDVWTTRITRPLAQMRIGEICELVAHLKIDETRVNTLTDALAVHNLNGVALQTCDLADLRTTLEVKKFVRVRALVALFWNVVIVV